jgi:hypothetical protein
MSEDRMTVELNNKPELLEGKFFASAEAYSDACLQCTYKSVSRGRKDDYVDLSMRPENGGYELEVEVVQRDQTYRLENVEELRIRITGGWEREALLRFLGKIVEAEKIIDIVK